MNESNINMWYQEQTKNKINEHATIVWAWFELFGLVIEIFFSKSIDMKILLKIQLQNLFYVINRELIQTKSLKHDTL